MFYPKALFRLLKENPRYAGEAEEVLLKENSISFNTFLRRSLVKDMFPQPACQHEEKGKEGMQQKYSLEE